MADVSPDNQEQTITTEPVSEPIQPQEQLSSPPTLNDTPVETVSPVSTNPFSAQPPVTETTEPVAKKRFPKWFLPVVIAAAAVVVLGGTSAFAYFGWYQNPEKVVYDALSNAATSETVSFNGNVNIDSEGSSYDVTVDGKINKDSESEIALQANIGSGKDSFEVKGGFISDKNGNLYVKVDQVKDLLTQVLGNATAGQYITYYGDVIEMIDNKWIKISSDDLSSVSKDYSNTQKCITDLSKKYGDNKATQKQLGDILAANRFITIEKDLGSKKVGDVATVGYQIGLDTEKAVSFAHAVAETDLGKDLKKCDDSYDLSKISKSDFDGNADGGVIEMWITPMGHTLTELIVKGSSDDANITLSVRPIFNQPVTVSIPESKTTIKDVFEKFQSSTTQLYGSYSYSGLSDDSSILN